MKNNQVYISTYRGRFAIYSFRTNQKWANEMFDSKQEVLDFCHQNGLLVFDLLQTHITDSTNAINVLCNTIKQLESEKKELYATCLQLENELID